MNHLIKKIYETLDTKIKFHIPNETSVEGRELTYGWIYHNNYPDLPDDWDWSWVISRGKFSGTLPKRISQYLFKEHQIKIEPKELAKLGTSLSAHTKGDEYTFDFTKNFNWKSGDFGDGGSCFWGDRHRARDIIFDAGGCAIRFWEIRPKPKPHCEARLCMDEYRQKLAVYNEGSMTGYGRSWIVPYSEGVILFNTYSYKQNDSTPSVDSLKVARILSLYLGGSYKKIGLTANGRSEGTLYINGGT